MRYLGVILGLLLATPAAAIDFRQTITQLDGTPFKEASSLAVVAENALLLSYPDEPNLSGEEKTKRYWLAMKIQAWVDHPVPGNNDLKLNAEDIALLKKLIGKAYAPLIVGQAWKLLDPQSVPDDAPSK